MQLLHLPLYLMLYFEPFHTPTNVVDIMSIFADISVTAVY